MRPAVTVIFTIVNMQSTDCYALANSNSGCQTVDPSQASYGTQFNVLKGGIFAMMWADDGIRVCASISRHLLPLSLSTFEWV
jgi:hypothetical protein